MEIDLVGAWPSRLPHVLLCCLLFSPACSDNDPNSGLSDLSDGSQDVGSDSDGQDVAPGDLADGQDDDVDGDLDETADTQGVLPLIQDVLTCGAPGPAGGLANGDALFRQDVSLETYPNALCNDGTGGVFYVRRATRPEDEDRWVLYMQGGGGCNRPNSCADRWCSVGTNFGNLKMSTNRAPEGGIAGRGIQRPSEENPFATWNHVLLYYCSSDMWAGTARDVEVATTEPAGSEDVSFRMHFLGSFIVDAVVDTLRGQEGVVSYTDAGGTTLEMPDLDDAEVVVLAGSSAGSGGVRNNVDRVAALLRETNNNCQGDTCNLDIRAWLDAAWGPNRELLGYEQTTLCLNQSLCDFEAVISEQYDANTNFQGWQGDQSCLDWHAENDPGSEWICADLGHTVRHHVTTPMFVRQDQSDSLVMTNTVDTNFTVPSMDGAVLNNNRFALLVAQELADFADLASTAEEGAEISMVPGVFSPRCGDHESIRSNGPTFDVTIDVDGNDYNTVEVIQNWMSGEQPISAIAADAATFSCP